MTGQPFRATPHGSLAWEIPHASGGTSGFRMGGAHIVEVVNSASMVHLPNDCHTEDISTTNKEPQNIEKFDRCQLGPTKLLPNEFDDSREPTTMR